MVALLLLWTGDGSYVEEKNGAHLWIIDRDVSKAAYFCCLVKANAGWPDWRLPGKTICPPYKNVENLKGNVVFVKIFDYEFFTTVHCDIFFFSFYYDRQIFHLELPSWCHLISCPVMTEQESFTSDSDWMKAWQKVPEKQPWCEIHLSFFFCFFFLDETWGHCVLVIDWTVNGFAFYTRLIKCLSFTAARQ